MRKSKTASLLLYVATSVSLLPLATAQQEPCTDKTRPTDQIPTCPIGQSGDQIAKQARLKKLQPNPKDRYQYWFAHLNDLDRAIEQRNPEWKIHVDWSIQDIGMVEPNIQIAWFKLGIFDEAYCAPTALNRVTAMQIAISKAKAGDCDNAVEITQSTQCHNPEAMSVLSNVDERDICNYLKSK